MGNNKNVFRVWIVALAVFVGLATTMVTADVQIASSQMYGYCENVVRGFPLPVQYAGQQYSHTPVLPDQPGGTVFATCIWPEAPGAGSFVWGNVILNIVLYGALALSILNLIPRRSGRIDMKIFLYGVSILVVGMWIWIRLTQYRNYIDTPESLSRVEDIYYFIQVIM